MGCGGKGAERVLLPHETWSKTGHWGGTVLDSGIGVLTRRSPIAFGAAPQRWGPGPGLGLSSHLAWFFVANPQRGLWPVQEQRAAGLAVDSGVVWEAAVGIHQASGPTPAWPQQPWHLSGPEAMFGSWRGQRLGDQVAAGD